MKARRGQALIEFAIISFVLSAILAGLLGILVLGLGSFQNNIASENAGRILDGNAVLIEQNFRNHFSDPIDPDYFDPAQDFENITARQVYRFLNEYPIDADGRVLYDETWLVMTPTEYFTSRDDDDNPLNVPEINLSLLGQYIFDPDLIPDEETEQGAYRFPGAVVRNAANQQTVLVPILPGPGSTGIDRTFHITSTNSNDFYPVSQDWVAPVTIGRTADGSGFRVNMFHPSQPASTINMNIVRDAQGDIVSQAPVEADDNAVGNSIGLPPTDYTMSPAASNNPAFGASSSRGEYGLGESYAFVKTVRPFRAVFETSSVFRMGAQLNPILVKYEADETTIPFPTLENEDVAFTNHTTDVAVDPFVNPAAYENRGDQVLNFDQQVIDRNGTDLKRFFETGITIDPPASADNDFVENVLWLLPNDDGVWRVSVSAEFQIFDDPLISSDDAYDWAEPHELELRLYKNGAFERLITRQVVTDDLFDPADAERRVVLQGDVLTDAVEGEILQVRVFTSRPASATDLYEVHLTGTPENNWLTFERVQD